MDENKLTFIDLFAGCGGLTEGFLQSGYYKALAHVEWELQMVNTLRNRLKSKWNHTEEEAIKRVIHFDIQKSDELLNGNWSDDTLNKYSETNHELIINGGLKELIDNKKVNLIIGGPPCQAYSIAGRAQDKDSMKFDYRNYLFESFVKVVNEFEPDIFVFENVPGILSACPGDKPVKERIYAAFENIGYVILKPDSLKKAVYSSYDFGVPQKRRRVIIIGIKKSTGLTPEEVYKSVDVNKLTENRRNIRDAIYHLPELIPIGESINEKGRKISHIQKNGVKVKYHEPRFHNKRDIGIFKDWILNEMNNKSSEEKIAFYNNELGKNSKHGKYRNLEWNEPSPTIVAHLHKDGLMFIHPEPEQARTITVKEAALLQSFPDDFEFSGNNSDFYKMIGNAVPPEMAKQIAIGISEIFKKQNEKIKEKAQDTCCM